MELAKNNVDSGHAQMTPFAGPWRRFFARMFDVYVGVILLGIAGELTLGRTASWYVELMTKPNTDMLVGVIFLPFALALDALVCQLFGNNLGKYLLGVEVKKIKGSMTLNDWVSRASNVWRSGYAFGVPPFSLWTFWREYKLVGMALQSTYDRRCGFQVFGRPLSVARKLGAAISLAAIFAVVIGLTAMSKERDRDMANIARTPAYSWQNPATKLEASVNAAWKYDAKTNKDGVYVYTFTEVTDHAVMIFGLESGSIALNTYVNSLIQGTSESMAYSDGGRYLDRSGVQTWEGHGTMKGAPDSRLRVEVRKSGSDFWRLVTIQTPPFDYSDAKVNALNTSLWMTVPLSASPASSPGT